MTDPVVKIRLPFLDIARGIAILCMASYHFSWDLEFFHYLDPGTVSSGLFRLYARMIASSFLFMAGFSLFLSHGEAIQWAKFGRRFAMIAAAAAAVSLVTYFAMPEGFIFFGILHEIALASAVGLLFLALPTPILLVAGIAALLAPDYLRSPLFDQPLLLWVGLSQTLPHSNDYVPFLPWIAPFLFGMSVAKLSTQFRILERFASLKPITNPVGRIFSLAGRHSLAIYLVHQPVLFGVVWVIAQILPAPLPNPETGYVKACQMQCEQQESQAFCTAFCTCTLEKLKESNLLTQLQAGKIDVKKDEGISRISQDCSMLALQPGTQQ